jgi:hypothetical protein
VLGIRNQIRIFIFFSLREPEVQLRLRLRILPFSFKCVEQTEIMLALAKNKNFKTEDNMPVDKLKETNMKKGRKRKKGVGSGSTEVWIRGSGSTPKCHGSPTLLRRARILDEPDSLGGWRLEYVHVVRQGHGEQGARPLAHPAEGDGRLVPR